MSKIVAVVAVVLSIAAAGSAEAMTNRGHSLSFAHFPTCAAGQVKALCVCRSEKAPRRQGLCAVGHYCHPYDGACTP